MENYHDNNKKAKKKDKFIHNNIKNPYNIDNQINYVIDNKNYKNNFNNAIDSTYYYPKENNVYFNYQKTDVYDYNDQTIENNQYIQNSYYSYYNDNNNGSIYLKNNNQIHSNYQYNNMYNNYNYETQQFKHNKNKNNEDIANNNQYNIHIANKTKNNKAFFYQTNNDKYQNNNKLTFSNKINRKINNNPINDSISSTLSINKLESDKQNEIKSLSFNFLYESETSKEFIEKVSKYIFKDIIICDIFIKKMISFINKKLNLVNSVYSSNFSLYYPLFFQSFEISFKEVIEDEIFENKKSKKELKQKKLKINQINEVEKKLDNTSEIKEENIVSNTENINDTTKLDDNNNDIDLNDLNNLNDMTDLTEKIQIHNNSNNKDICDKTDKTEEEKDKINEINEMKEKFSDRKFISYNNFEYTYKELRTNNLFRNVEFLKNLKSKLNDKFTQLTNYLTSNFNLLLSDNSNFYYESIQNYDEFYTFGEIFSNLITYERKIFLISELSNFNSFFSLKSIDFLIYIDKKFFKKVNIEKIAPKLLRYFSSSNFNFKDNYNHNFEIIVLIIKILGININLENVFEILKKQILKRTEFNYIISILLEEKLKPSILTEILEINNKIMLLNDSNLRKIYKNLENYSINSMMYLYYLEKLSILNLIEIGFINEKFSFPSFLIEGNCAKNIFIYSLNLVQFAYQAFNENKELTTEYFNKSYKINAYKVHIIKAIKELFNLKEKLKSNKKEEYEIAERLILNLDDHKNNPVNILLHLLNIDFCKIYLYTTYYNPYLGYTKGKIEEHMIKNSSISKKFDKKNKKVSNENENIIESKNDCLNNQLEDDDETYDLPPFLMVKEKFDKIIIIESIKQIDKIYKLIDSENNNDINIAFDSEWLSESYSNYNKDIDILQFSNGNCNILINFYKLRLEKYIEDNNIKNLNFEDFSINEGNVKLDSKLYDVIDDVLNQSNKIINFAGDSDIRKFNETLKRIFIKYSTKTIDIQKIMALNHAYLLQKYIDSNTKQDSQIIKKIKDKSFSLAFTVELILNKFLCKTETLSYWRNSKLRESQIHYAICDVLTLIEIYNILITDKLIVFIQ